MSASTRVEIDKFVHAVSKTTQRTDEKKVAKITNVMTSAPWFTLSDFTTMRQSENLSIRAAANESRAKMFSLAAKSVMNAVDDGVDSLDEMKSWCGADSDSGSDLITAAARKAA